MVASRLFLVLLAASLLSALPVSAQQPASPTIISGGDLPHSIRMTAADVDAFKRRIELPPLLEQAPAVSGPAYLVASPYWAEAVSNGSSDSGNVEPGATYYPSAGVVRARRDGDDVWLLLDLRQRAILGRYLRLAAGLSETPSTLDVLRAAAPAEPMGITVGTLELTPEQRQRFWAAAESLRSRPGAGAALAADPAATWVIFNLAEGRAIQMRYSPASGTLTEALSGEVYIVPADWLVPVLGAVAAPGPGYGLAPLAVPQQEGAGSAAWWPIMIGGGAACLLAAIWLQRRWPGRRL